MDDAPRNRIHQALPQAGSDCVYEGPNHREPGYEGGLPLIETPGLVQTWITGSPVLLGSVWYWTHRRWERKEKKD